VSPIFLQIAPEMKPRTLCFCQPVAATMSASVAPSGRRSSSRTWAFLLPSRALGARVSGLGLHGRLGLLRRAGRGVLGGGGIQSLDGLPDPGDGRLAVRELLDRLQFVEGDRAGERVPDLDEAADGPLGAVSGEFLFAVEVLVTFRYLLGGSEGRDVVVGV